jgi:hypothetical protein
MVDCLTNILRDERGALAAVSLRSLNRAIQIVLGAQDQRFRVLFKPKKVIHQVVCRGRDKVWIETMLTSYGVGSPFQKQYCVRGFRTRLKAGSTKS